VAVEFAKTRQRAQRVEIIVEDGNLHGQNCAATTA
jgi:hypothetical protein